MASTIVVFFFTGKRKTREANKTKTVTKNETYVLEFGIHDRIIDAVLAARRRDI
jgi:hypothetical protein